MYTLNEKIKNLQPYDPISGNYKIRLDANESCVNLPDYMIEKIKETVGNINFNRYPDPYAKELCRAFAEYYGINPLSVTAGNGSDELICLLMTAFLMKGETLITIEPDFSMYRFYTSITEINCVSVQKNSDLSIDINKLISAVHKNKAGAVIFSNPCNPTSLGLSKEDIIKLIKSVDSLVILDEAYMDFWEESLLNRVNDFDNLVILRTASKAVGAASIRLGFAVANEKITNALKAVKAPYNVNSVTQAIGTIIYSDKEYLKNIRKTIVSLRKSLYNDFKALEALYPEKIKLIDGCSNFIFIKTDEASDIFNFLLSKGVAIRLMNDYIRITAGNEEENTELLGLLKEYLKQ